MPVAVKVSLPASRWSGWRHPRHHADRGHGRRPFRPFTATVQAYLTGRAGVAEAYAEPALSGMAR